MILAHWIFGEGEALLFVLRIHYHVPGRSIIVGRNGTLKAMKLFVPGRICLFGEHTDWAGGYRRHDPGLEKGLALIVGTNQGVHARVAKHPDRLIFKATLNDGTAKGPRTIRMAASALLQEAREGGFFSYAAGVTYQIMTHYSVGGLEVDNYLTDLPIQKGLSSSAAVCVLVARAFNRLYDLGMSLREEMEHAYAGEITTPSRCGRLDQGCAYGSRPIMMTFDGDDLAIEEVRPAKDLFYVLVDLNAGKNTREILTSLNRCYPHPQDDQGRSVQDYLGSTSARITRQAADALVRGDAEQLGALMVEAQEAFDKHVAPACRSQLAAPVLHKVLAYGPIQAHILGGKGVGSQGDGSAQFLVKDRASQDRVMEIIEEELNMSCISLTVRAAGPVRKAVIPAAGHGRRHFPASKVVKKEFFPVLDRAGRTKPAILSIVEEALSAGIEQIAIIVQKEDHPLFESFFQLPPSPDYFEKLDPEAKEYAGYLAGIGRSVTFIRQERQDGFGDAVFRARDWVGADPFLLLLGDHLYESAMAKSCARQLLDVFDRERGNLVGLAVSPESAISRCGCVAGKWILEQTHLSVTRIVEKPQPAYAEQNLRVPGLGEGRYLTLFGLYVLSPRIFELLEEVIAEDQRESGEFQLTSSLQRLSREEGMTGVLLKGKAFDIGAPESYRDTLRNFTDE